MFAHHLSDGPASAFSGYLANFHEGHGPKQFVQTVLSSVRVRTYTHRQYSHTVGSGLFPRRSECNTGIVHVGFVVGAVALGTVYCRVLQLTQSVIPPCPRVTYHQGLAKQQFERPASLHSYH